MRLKQISKGPPLHSTTPFNDGQAELLHYPASNLRAVVDRAASCDAGTECAQPLDTAATSGVVRLAPALALVDRVVVAGLAFGRVADAIGILRADFDPVGEVIARISVAPRVLRNRKLHKHSAGPADEIAIDKAFFGCNRIAPLQLSRRRSKPTSS